MRIYALLGDAVVAPALSIPAVGLAAVIPYGPGPLAHYTVRKQPAAGSCHYRYTSAKQPLPDRRCTPGARNPKVKPLTLATTICKPGYTARIRPPSSVTAVEKRTNAVSIANCL